MHTNIIVSIDHPTHRWSKFYTKDMSLLSDPDGHFLLSLAPGGAALSAQNPDVTPADHRTMLE